jgi:hypothetical protein
VHWFYPAFTDPKTDPAAINIAAKRRRTLLPDTVRPAACPAGDLRVVTVISAKRRRVKQVEKKLEKMTAASNISAHFADDHVQQWLLRMDASR